jgi:hypothetical protein
MDLDLPARSPANMMVPTSEANEAMEWIAFASSPAAVEHDARISRSDSQ